MRAFWILVHFFAVLSKTTTWNDQVLTHFNPRPNDRNISTQHIATLLSATCCVRLATLLQRVTTCCVLLAQIWKWSNLSWSICGCCMMLLSFGQGMRTSSIFNSQHVGGQTQATCCAQQCCDLLRLNVAIVWRELANAGANNDGKWCTEMFVARCWAGALENENLNG